jgi:uncharacterized membrane protein YfbV (UPF0208 family)
MKKVVQKIKCGLFLTAVCLVLSLLRTAPAQNLPALNRDAILGHLNAAITWYRDAHNKVQAEGLPSDALYEESTRQLAADALRLAFQAARAEAAVITASEKVGNAAAGPAPAQHQDFTQMATRIATEMDDTQTRLDAVNKQLASAPRSKRAELLAQRDKLQGELSLDKTVQDAVQKMAAFAEGAPDTVTEGLE